MTPTLPEEVKNAVAKALRESRWLVPAPAVELILTAALPFLSVQVAVKKLDWIRPPLSDTLSRCDTDFGTYRTWTHDEANGKWFWSVEGGWNEANGEAPNEEAAKAAAQADYEARILSALEPSAGRAAVLEEARLIELLRNAHRVLGGGGDEAFQETVALNVKYALEEYDAIASHPVADKPDEAGVQGDEWRPIKSAPKDGTEFLGHDASTKTTHVTFANSNGYFHDPDSHYYSEAPEFNPTHWRPLPSSPLEGSV